MADLFGEEEVAVTDGQYVVLVSSDGHRFYVSRKVAIASNTIKEMLSGPGTHHQHLHRVIACCCTSPSLECDE